MAGAGFSGKDGTVKIGSADIAEIRNWKFNPKSNNPKYASNRTSGYKRTVAGVKEGSGSMSGAMDHADLFLDVVDVGMSADLKLYVDATHFYLVPAVIDDCSLNVDIDNGEIVAWDSNFSTNGAWTNPTESMTLAMQAGNDREGRAGGLPPQRQANPMMTPEMATMVAQIAAAAATQAIEAAAERLGLKPKPAEPVAEAASAVA